MRRSPITLIILSCLFRIIASSNLKGKAICPDKCITCHVDNICLQCNPGYFKTEKSNCEICTSPCESCEKTASGCVDCVKGFSMVDGKCTETSFSKSMIGLVVALVIVALIVFLLSVLCIKYKLRRSRMDSRKWLLESEHGSIKGDESQRNSIMGRVSAGDYSVFGDYYSKKKREEWKITDDNEWENQLAEDEDHVATTKKRGDSKSFIYDNASDMLISAEEQRDFVGDVKIQRKRKKNNIKRLNTSIPNKSTNEKISSTNSVRSDGLDDSDSEIVEGGSERVICKSSNISMRHDTVMIQPLDNSDESNLQTVRGSFIETSIKPSIQGTDPSNDLQENEEERVNRRETIESDFGTCIGDTSMDTFTNSMFNN